MSQAGFCTVDDASRLLADLHTGVGQVRDGQWWKLSPDDLLDIGRDVERLARLVYACQIHIAGELVAQDAAKQTGFHSPATMLRLGLNIAAGDAQARVRAARHLLPQDLPSGGETPPQLPALAAAVAAGDVGPDHVRIISHTIRSLPTAIDPHTRADAEQFLTTEALQHSPNELDKIAEKLQNTLDPDGVLDDKHPADKAELRFGNRNHSTGLTPLTGRLDDLGVATVRKALDALAAPRPETDGSKDPRPPATRLAHALTEAMGIFLNTGLGPAQGGVRPHLSVLIDWDTLNQAYRSATLDTGHPLSLSQLRQLACDAEILPAILTGFGAVASLGRTTRTFSTAQRRAIVIRDRGCVFPGCDRPAAWADFHHIAWWHRDLGETSIHNGCLLCAHHHTLIHRGEWQIRMAEDGRPEIIPPRWIDQHQKPRRNTLHHLIQ